MLEFRYFGTSKQKQRQQIHVLEALPITGALKKSAVQFVTKIVSLRFFQTCQSRPLGLVVGNVSLH